MIKAKEGKIMVNGPADEIFGDFVGIIKAIYECFEGVAGEKTARQMIADAGKKRSATSSKSMQSDALI